MGIIRKQVTAAERESTSTHFPNETEKKPEDSDQAALNNQDPETLIDPEDAEGGNTHFLNEEEDTPETRRMNASAKPVQAAGKSATTTKVTMKAPKHPGTVPLSKEKGPTHPAKTKAGLDENDPTGIDDPDFVQGPDADGDFPAGGPDSGTQKVATAKKAGTNAATRIKADGDDEPGLQDTQHFSNFENPTDGYLEVEEKGLLAHKTPGEQAAEDFGGAVDLPNGNAPQQGLEVMGGEDEFDDTEEVVVDPESVADDELEETAGPGEEEMSILDVDGADDEPEDVVFANVGTSVKVIKANRIIASMSKKVAAAAGHGDLYLSDQFAQVTEVEMAKHGVRAGLKKMGFVFATVNLGKAEVLNKRVEAKAKKLTASARAEAQAQFDVLEQALAIAAVGINKGFFKDVPNELRASLETELAAAGVRGHKQMLHSIFATKGIDFAKAILAVAKGVAVKSDEIRAEYVKALDMVGEGMNDDEDLFGGAASPDFQSQFAGEEGVEGDDEFADEVAGEEAPQTVHAALVRPASNLRSSREVSARATGYSVTAAAILSGKVPLPFA
jgi:hypothetical protein